MSIIESQCDRDLVNNKHRQNAQNTHPHFTVFNSIPGKNFSNAHMKFTLTRHSPKML